jgi:hypothetical protein
MHGSAQAGVLHGVRRLKPARCGTGLDGVTAANVAAIEIIHNPSARFDAAGMAGIINIIYKQEQQLGLSGDVGMALGFGQFTKQRDDLPTWLPSGRC